MADELTLTGSLVHIIGFTLKFYYLLVII